MRLSDHDERKLMLAMWDALQPYQNKRHKKKNEAMEQSAANYAIRFFNDWLQQNGENK